MVDRGVCETYRETVRITIPRRDGRVQAIRFALVFAAVARDPRRGPRLACFLLLPDRRPRCMVEPIRERSLVMKYSRWMFWGGLTAALFLGTSGCATRGYVRNQVGNLNRQLSAKDGELYNDIEAIRGSASTAQARADEAFNGADLARKLALGNEGFRE